MYVVDYVVIIKTLKNGFLEVRKSGEDAVIAITDGIANWINNFHTFSVPNESGTSFFILVILITH